MLSILDFAISNWELGEKTVSETVFYNGCRQ